MKYLKKYEAIKDKLLYKNEDFKIYINVNNFFTFESISTQMSAIFAMARLVRTDSKYLQDKKLRDIEIPEFNKEQDLKCLNNYKNENRKNLINNRTGEIEDFLWSNRKEVQNVSKSIYINLIDKYYPELIDILNKSKTLGDIIDHFILLHKDMKSYLEIISHSDKYNL